MVEVARLGGARTLNPVRFRREILYRDERSAVIAKAASAVGHVCSAMAGHHPACGQCENPDPIFRSACTFGVARVGTQLPQNYPLTALVVDTYTALVAPSVPDEQSGLTM